MTTQELQKSQKEFDDLYWDHDGYGEFENIRHLTLHVGKLLGKLSAYCEEKEHAVDTPIDKVRDEVIPDLLCYSLMLSNWLGADLSAQYQKRLDYNKNRLTPNK